jgi:hypothetical protein
MSVKPFNWGGLHDKLAKLGGSAGSTTPHLPSAPTVLSDSNLSPLGRPKEPGFGAIGGGAAYGGGGKGSMGMTMQSPAQHQAVEKAAKVSAAKRRRFI